MNMQINSTGELAAQRDRLVILKGGVVCCRAEFVFDSIDGDDPPSCEVQLLLVVNKKLFISNQKQQLLTYTHTCTMVPITSQ